MVWMMDVRMIFGASGVNSVDAKDCDDMVDVGRGRRMEEKEASVGSSSMKSIRTASSLCEESSWTKVVSKGRKRAVSTTAKESTPNKDAFTSKSNNRILSASANKYKILDNVLSFAVGKGIDVEDDVKIVSTKFKDFSSTFAKDIVVMTEDDYPRSGKEALSKVVLDPEYNEDACIFSSELMKQAASTISHLFTTAATCDLNFSCDDSKFIEATMDSLASWKPNSEKVSLDKLSILLRNFVCEKEILLPSCS